MKLKRCLQCANSRNVFCEVLSPRLEQGKRVFDGPSSGGARFAARQTLQLNLQPIGHERRSQRDTFVEWRGANFIRSIVGADATAHVYFSPSLPKRCGAFETHRGAGLKLRNSKRQGLRSSCVLFATIGLVCSPGCDSGASPESNAVAGSGGSVSSVGGASPADGGFDGGCSNGFEFHVSKNVVSPKMATVGVVEWSLAGRQPSSAKIVFKLKNAEDSTLNQDGEAPVDLSKPNYRTLLLGLKQSRNYTFHIDATRDGRTCASNEYALPQTGDFPDSRPVTVTVAQPTKREPGFIVTSSGTFFPDSAFIIDADGDVVWYAPGPLNTSRAQMDYAGDNMWMVSLNMINTTGEMRTISMDGEQEQRNIPGLENSHHDLTVMPGGKVATVVWVNDQVDPESELVVRAPDGTLSSLFRIGNNVYQSGAFHANALHYCPLDGGFTVADRNPNVFVKVSAAGIPEWQVGGVCDGAPVGNKCFPEDWQVVHGHHWLEDGTLLAFNNGYTGLAHVFEFSVNSTPSSFTATPIQNYEGTYSSFNMGDVQRLPGGNTLITYSTDAMIVELDSDWNEVQTFSARVGYSSWRPTLYGPPTRP